jgi:DNA-binding transcriptional MerR regulator
VPQHVLRFWESRFAQIKPVKRGGGRRYYRPDDIDLLRGIRFLLYAEGYTIRGVQRILRERGVRFVQTIWQEGTNQLALHHGATDAEDGEANGFALRLASDQANSEDDFDASAFAQNVSAPDPAPLRLASDPMPETRRAPRPQAAVGLTRDDLNRLKATLEELTECQRLLLAARDAEDS